MAAKYRTSWLLCLFALGLLLPSCGSPVPESEVDTKTPGPELRTTVSETEALISPLTQHSPLPTPPPPPTEEPTPQAVQDSLELVVLHTNDNWGETEPCG